MMHYINLRFYRATLGYRAEHAIVVSVWQCVCVCVTHAVIVPKRLNREARKQRHTIAQGLLFSGDKEIGEIRTESSQWVRAKYKLGRLTLVLQWYFLKRTLQLGGG